MGTTVKQRNFAKLVAQGLPHTKAYEQAYGSRGGKRRTRQVEAQAVANHPEVRAEIEAYEAQLVPIGDLAECKRQMLANIRSLALYSPDQKVRLAASIKLHDYIDEREAREARNRKTVTIDALIGEIGELAPPEALELETVDETAPDPAAAVPTEAEEPDPEDIEDPDPEDVEDPDPEEVEDPDPEDIEDPVEPEEPADNE